MQLTRRGFCSINFSKIFTIFNYGCFGIDIGPNSIPFFSFLNLNNYDLNFIDFNIYFILFFIAIRKCYII